MRQVVIGRGSRLRFATGAGALWALTLVGLGACGAAEEPDSVVLPTSQLDDGTPAGAATAPADAAPRTGADPASASAGASDTDGPGASSGVGSMESAIGAAGSGGGTETTDDAADEVEVGMTAPAHVPPCIDDPSDVALIGDSYVSWITHTFVADLAAESGQTWPNYAIGGTSLATGGIGPIPAQLDTALASNPDTRLIVMSGGGNDILVPDTVMFPEAAQCTRTPDAPMIDDCRAIVEAALDAARGLMLDSADAGIRDVVYFFYPRIPGGGLISGPSPNAILEYALPLARQVCESAIEVTEGRMQCHFVDMVPVFEGKSGLFADVWSEAGDGVHPNSKGSKVMAEEVWRVMQEACLAQPSGSGCCE